MIIFMGLAGSGKSTQGQILAAYMHCPWISTGNLLREHNFDVEVQQQMLAGEIISDEQTIKILDKELKRLDVDRRECILDGSPRTLEQAKWLINKVKDHELKITAVIHLKISPELSKDRLLARRRPDDHEEAIAERFHEYETQVKPILAYLKTNNIRVFDIDGGQTLPEVAADIVKDLDIKAV